MRQILFLLLTLFVFCCNCQNNIQNIINVNNTLNIGRSFETVEINRSHLNLDNANDFEKLSVKDMTSGAILISQFIDSDQDGNADLLLFQPEMEPNSTRQYQLVIVNDSEKPNVEDLCYSRFVPERTDDYAWENNKVAFRTFGPVAQKMIEQNVKGGTLSSGMDAWLKRVEYPIINKWYKKNDEKLGAYHYDDGEGLDNFHVGVSRGVGGIAVKKDSVYYVSKNFTKWKTISTGPIRTSFVLEYESWDAGGLTITETKHISLDYGSNLSKFEVEISGTHSIFAGLTLHEKDGMDTQNQKSGWVSYWQPHDDSELGTAIVVPNGYMLSSTRFETPVKDQSNLFAEIGVKDGKAIYYAGFGWKGAKEFTSKESWENYLNDFALKINNPLMVTLY